MKLRFFLPMLLCCAALTLGQTQPTAKAQAVTQSAEMPGQESGAGTTHHQPWSAQHQQEIQDMKADLDTLHTELIQMRSQIPWMDPRDQTVMNINVQMWDTLLARMNQIVNTLAVHAGMGSETTGGGTQSPTPPSANPRP